MDYTHHQLGIFSYNSLSYNSLSLTNLDKPANPEPQKLDDSMMANISLEATQLRKIESCRNPENENRGQNTPIISKKLNRNLDGLEANKFIIRTPKKGILVQKRTLQNSESAYFEKKTPRKVTLDITSPSSADKARGGDSFLLKEAKISQTPMVKNEKSVDNVLESEDSKDAKGSKKVTFMISEKKSIAAAKPELDKVEIPSKPTPKSINSQLAEIISSPSTKKFDELRISKTTTGFFASQNFTSPKSVLGILPKSSYILKPGQLPSPFETPTSAKKSLLLKQKTETQSIFQKEVDTSLKMKDQDLSKVTNNVKSLSFSSTAKPGISWLTPSPPLNLEKISLSRITKKQAPLSHRSEAGPRARLNINDLK